MPRYSFTNSALQGASAGLGKLASAIAGADKVGQDAYDKQMLTQSKISQAIAATQAYKARAAQDNAEAAVLAQRPEVFEESIAGKTGTTVPQVRAAREYMRTGTIPERELPGPADEMGNGPGSAPMIDPENLGAIAREISRFAPVFLSGTKDINPEQLAKSEREYREREVFDGTLSGAMPQDQTARALALLKATPIFKIPEGYTGNQFTGAIDIKDPVNALRQDYGRAQEQERRAAATENLARASNARASAAKSMAVASGTAPAKPMPAAALKMRQDAVDAIGTSSSMSADLEALLSQIEGGKLTLGPIDNFMSEARNYVGSSSENSRNYQSFKATLEKLRNDSLRLNKGVQTDGDAQRAWNELLTNINDPGVVAQRLREIDAINRRAMELHQFNLDLIEQNYGRQPTDTAPLRSQPAAIGSGANANAARKTVVRTGRDATGRKVVQFSDGSISYAD